MEWPSGAKPLSFKKALVSYLEDPEQPKDINDLRSLPVRLEELRGEEPTAWDNALELLANTCRNPKWREPVEKSGLLHYYLDNLDPDALPATSSTQLLRAIGNGVADRDESRSVTLPFLKNIAACLRKETLQTVALSVLYNTCLGYQPAQKEAAGLRLDRDLTKLLDDDNPMVSQVCELLAWITNELPEDGLEGSEDCLEAIIRYTASCEEWEDFKSIIAAASVYLQDPTIQKKLLLSDGFEQIISLLKKKTDQLAVLKHSMSEEEHKSFEEDLRIATGLVMNNLATITASDDFPRKYSLESRLIAEQGEWLAEGHPILQTCACILLGNLAISDETNIKMVQEMQWHIPTINILKTRSDRTLLFLAAGYLRHLAQPKENVETVSDADAIPVCAALLSQKQPELDFEIAAIFRRLTNHSFNNTAKLVHHEEAMEKLLAATSATRTAFEVGRLLVVMSRRLREAEGARRQQETTELWDRLFSHRDIVKPLLLMVKQEQVPVLAAEAWFGLGLMAADQQGARIIADAFRDEEAFAQLESALTGENEANKGNSSTLVHLLAPHAEDDELKAKFEGLAKQSQTISN
ncbi:uncharacterized protein J3D65DRAFT_336216 [Phyllosticta citribraziliensis]|uniref:Uncharacterized protein n=1 Tax=Phyllosticta citribraziliensis TaxID=989973 RepID=A0ABR1LTX8_9PEZI